MIELVVRILLVEMTKHKSRKTKKKTMVIHWINRDCRKQLRRGKNYMLRGSNKDNNQYCQDDSIYSTKKADL